MKFINNIKYILLCILLFLMAISYHPFFFGDINAEVEVGNRVLSLPIYISFVALFLLSFLTAKKLNTKLFMVSLVSFVIIGVLAWFILAVFGDATMISDIKVLLFVVASIVIGKSLNLSDRKLLILVAVFGLTALLSGIMQVYQNIGGFIILDQYRANSKNSLGAILATAVISFIYAASRTKKTIRIAFVAFAVLGIIVVLTIRARASFLAIVLVIMAIFMRQIKSKGVIWAFVILLVGGILLALAPDSVSNFVIDSITAGRQGGDITSGRMGAYQQALSIFSSSPFLGNIAEQQEIAWVHNYLLLKLSNFGLLFAWPFFVYYFFLLIYCFKHMLRTNQKREDLPLFYQGFPLVLIPFVISILEPTFPFAPGTAVAYNFIMLGLSDSYYHSRLSN
ncbi:MAG: hypothetical protein II874_06070 [Bacteroidales bacterium]|nr:hypothetical protein [Bacteroidales bacterium]